MSQPAIHIEHIGKQYKLGLRDRVDRSFRELVTGCFTAPLRRLRHLSERSADDALFWALRDVSFDVQTGEVIGIVGRNGAGKSTLLKILSRITEPTTGRAVIRGRVRSLLEVGTGFHGELSGRENIYLNGAILGMKKAEIDRKFDEIVAFAGVEKFLDTPVKRYSSGMSVRLAFAVAAHLEPEILLIDEVLAVGDVPFQNKCLGKMADVARRGRTILFVSHNMAAVSQLCSRVVVLADGRDVFDGAPAEGIRRYLNESNTTRAHNTFPDEPSKAMQVTEMALERGDREVTHVDVRDGCSLRVGYRIREWTPGTYVCVAVSTENGLYVLWSSDIGDAHELNVERRPGDYQARITIPANVLAPGTYYCSAAICAIGVQQAFDFRQRSLCFEVEDNDDMLARFGIKFPGVTAVPLNWSTEYVGADGRRHGSAQLAAVSV